MGVKVGHGDYNEINSLEKIIIILRALGESWKSILTNFSSRVATRSYLSWFSKAKPKNWNIAQDIFTKFGV